MIPEALIVFGVPDDGQHWPELSLIRDLPSSQIVILPSPGAEEFERPYRILNKVNLLGGIGNRPSLLCDSDLIFVRKFPVQFFEFIEIGVKVADASSWRGDWKYIYSSFGLRVPERRVMTTTTKEISLPYYNSGFMYCRRPDLLAPSWKYAVSKILRDRQIEGRYPYADQISLPVAMQLASQEITELDVAFNQSIHAAVGNYFVLHHHDYYELLEKTIPELLKHWMSTSSKFAEAYRQVSTRFTREPKIAASLSA